MPGRNTGREKDKSTGAGGDHTGNALIESKLRSYYDSLVDEGTPDQILDLLQRLDDAERKSNKGE
ncbi:MAG: NepR family anti-sigma factor [Allorhizobium sp.]